MSVVLDTLRRDSRVARLGAGDLDAFLAAAPQAVAALLFAGDPDKRPETADVAVVVRELLGMYGSALQVGIVEPDAEAALMGACAVSALPSLVLYGPGAPRPRGEITPKIQDWTVYTQKIAALLAARDAAEAAHA